MKKLPDWLKLTILLTVLAIMLFKVGSALYAGHQGLKDKDQDTVMGDF